MVADRAGHLQQRDAHLPRGDGGHAGPHPVAAYQCARRGARAADRLLRPHRPQHADRAAEGVGHHPHDRSLGRLVLRRAADLRAREERLGPHPGGRGDGRHGEGDRGQPAQAAHRGGIREDASPHRRRPAGGDRRQQVSPRAGSRGEAAQGRQRCGAAVADR